MKCRGEKLDSRGPIGVYGAQLSQKRVLFYRSVDPEESRTSTSVRLPREALRSAKIQVAELSFEKPSPRTNFQ